VYCINMSSIVFAQLCQQTNAIETNTATVFELYNNDTQTSLDTPHEITVDDFKSLFYSGTGDTFRISENCETLAANFKDLNNQWELEGVDVSFDLVDTVIKQWEIDLNLLQKQWSSCSVMTITSQLQEVTDLCKFACQTGCCSLSLAELETANGGALAPDDLVTLSMLITNGNPGTNPVELRLNFKLTA